MPFLHDTHLSGLAWRILSKFRAGRAFLSRFLPYPFPISENLMMISQADVLPSLSSRHADTTRGATLDRPTCAVRRNTCHARRYSGTRLHNLKRATRVEGAARVGGNSDHPREFWKRATKFALSIPTLGKSVGSERWL